MSENPPPNGRTSAFFGSLRNAVGFGRPKTLLPPIKSNKSSSEQPAPADNGDTVFRAGTPLKKRESFKLLLGAIQDVASLADEQLGNIDNNDHDQGNKSSCPQDISATKMTLFKQVSKLKNGNERILGGLDNILTMVEDGDKLKKSPSTQSEKKLDSMRRDMHHTMEEILKAREEELRKAFDAKLEAAVRLSLEFAQSEIHKAEEKHEKEMEIVKQESLDRERTVQLSAAQQAHDRIAGLTKMLVQNISHEIRSPLNVISAGLHIVEDQLMMSSVNGSVDVDDLIEIIKEIKQSCTECSVVLDDIVLYESIKNGGIKINSEIIHVFGLVRQVVRDFLLQAKLCNITIIYEDISSSAQDRGPTVLADKEKFIHVIRRMLSDAIRYTPSEGTVTIRVRWMPISSSTSHICYHGCIRIDFEDSGGGFSKVTRFETLQS